MSDEIVGPLPLPDGWHRSQTGKLYDSDIMYHLVFSEEFLAHIIRYKNKRHTWHAVVKGAVVNIPKELTINEACAWVQALVRLDG